MLALIGFFSAAIDGVIVVCNKSRPELIDSFQEDAYLFPESVFYEIVFVVYDKIGEKLSPTRPRVITEQLPDFGEQAVCCSNRRLTSNL